jgi:hypothetical protein
MNARAFVVGMLFSTATVVPTADLGAFDTGHHTDLTVNVLLWEGFSADATDVVVFENWMPDFFGPEITDYTRREADRSAALNYLTQSAGEAGRAVFDKEYRRLIQPYAAKLHFDNLESTDAVAQYWWRLTKNTERTVKALAKGKDRRGLLTVIGLSLHAVQDFYAHSTWVDDARAAEGRFPADTWFDVMARSNNRLRNVRVRTGRYPGAGQSSHDALNHDSYSRKNWDRAYALAYVASVQWVRQIKTWVSEIDPTLWGCLTNYGLTSGDRSKLTDDLEAMRMAGRLTAHWKGPSAPAQLGAAGALIRFANRGWTDPFVFEVRDKNLLYYIAEGLGDGEVTPAQRIQPAMEQSRAILLVLDTLADLIPANALPSRDPGELPGKVPAHQLPLQLVSQHATTSFSASIGGRAGSQAMSEDALAAQSNLPRAWRSLWFVPADAGNPPITIAVTIAYEGDATSGVYDLDPSPGKSFSLTMPLGNGNSGVAAGGVSIGNEPNSSARLHYAVTTLRF